MRTSDLPDTLHVGGGVVPTLAVVPGVGEGDEGGGEGAGLGQ